MLNIEMQEQNDQRSQISNLSETIRKAVPYLNLAYVLIASILMVGALGWFGDRYFQTKPVLTILGIFLGLGIGFYSIFKSLKHLEK
jgi:F0F1-type ATP synthase assembly protein I